MIADVEVLCLMLSWSLCEASERGAMCSFLFLDASGQAKKSPSPKICVCKKSFKPTKATACENS